MAKLTIEINCDNEAFHYRDEDDASVLDAGTEVARILDKARPEIEHRLTEDWIEDDGVVLSLLDINGGWVGHIKFTSGTINKG